MREKKVDVEAALAKAVAESSREALAKEVERKRVRVAKSASGLSEFLFKALVRNPKFWGMFIGIPDKDLYMFTRQLSLMLGSGLNYQRAFRILFEQVTNPKLKYLCFWALAGLQRGQRLSQLFREFEADLGEYYIGVVNAGERTGQLDYVLRVLADQLERHIKLKKKVQSALVYPLIVIFFGVGIVFFLFRFVLPNIFKVIENANITLPYYTRLLMKFTEFIQNPMNLLYSFLIVAFLALLLKFFTSTPMGKVFWDNLKIRLPIYGRLNKLFISLTFLRIFALVYEAGMPLLTSLAIAKKAVNNRMMDIVVDWAIQRIKEGARFSDIFGFHSYKANPKAMSKEEMFMMSLIEDLFPNMARSLIHVGDHAGDLITPMKKYIEFAEEELYRTLENISSIIEPIMILVLGILVGVILIAVMVPMYQMIKGFT